MQRSDSGYAAQRVLNIQLPGRRKIGGPPEKVGGCHVGGH